MAVSNPEYPRATFFFQINTWESNVDYSVRVLRALQTLKVFPPADGTCTHTIGALHRQNSVNAFEISEVSSNFSK